MGLSDFAKGNRFGHTAVEGSSAVASAPRGNGRGAPALAGLAALAVVLLAFFATAARAAEGPHAEAEAATEVSATKATLNGKVNPEGVAVTSCEFELYGETVTKKPCQGSIPTDGNDHHVSANFTGLKAGNFYYFQLVVKNAEGETVSGNSFQAAELARTEAPTNVTGTGGTMNGTVRPEGEAIEECFFEYGGQGHESEFKAPCAQTVPTDESAHPVSAQVSGLTPGTYYRYRLVIKQASGVTNGQSELLFTTGPTLVYERAQAVESESGALTGKLFRNKEPTEYHFEYGLTDSYGSSTPTFTLAPEDLKPGEQEKPVVVAETITGLTPSTAYHWRLVLVSAGGSIVGPDRIFTTRPPTPAPRTDCPNQEYRTGFSTDLPDCRAYELVSPPKKTGNVFVPNGLQGSCMLCLPGELSNPVPMQSAPDGNTMTYQGDPFGPNLSASPNQYLARRGATGWETESLSPPKVTGNEYGGYKGISPDLGRGVVYQSSRKQISPAAPVGFANLYFREGNGEFQPLITTAPPSYQPRDERFALLFQGANVGNGSVPGYTDLIFTANDALTGAVPNVAPAAPAVEESESNLYQWQGGKLTLVNVLPGNTQAQANAKLAASPFDHSISDDGSHVFWTSNDELFVRIDGTETQKILDGGEFLGASADGSEALLSDGCLYSLADESCKDELTEGKGEITGLLGSAQNLSHIYFVATQVLAGTNSEGKTPVDGKINLYVWENGTTTFIRSYVEEGQGQASETTARAWRRVYTQRFAQVTDDGNFLAFSWAPHLTNYDNEGPCEGNFGTLEFYDGPCLEVYVYAAAKHRLSCASCNYVTGQTPLALSNLSRPREGTLMAAIKLPGNLARSGGGRLFFESQDTLVPQDRNGHIRDVYEWVPEGMEGCSDSRGCQSLISSGTSPTDASFVDSSPDGRNAYFVTRQQLLPQDQDELLDLYDARIDGGFADTTPIPCRGEEACRGPAAEAPAVQTPSSSTFAGPGNPKTKPKKKKHKHKKKHHGVHKKHGKGKKHSKRSGKGNRGGSK